MLLPWRGMPSRSPRRVLRLALLLAPLVTACTGWPADDLGDAWVSGAPTQKIRWLTWSPDATKLYWIGGPAGTLYAMAAADRQPVALATVGSYPPPALTEGREIFYTTEDPATGSLNLTLATLGSDGTSLTTFQALGSGLFSYLASPDGTRLALTSAAVPVHTTIHAVGGGEDFDLGGGLEPLAFSPDGGALLSRNAASNGAATHYVLADSSTGATAYLSFPDNETISYVSSWTGETPSAVIVVNQVIDLQTGAATKLTGLSQVDALPGTAPTFAYGWDTGDCLDPYTSEAGDSLCEGAYRRIARADLATGMHDVIAAESVKAGNDADLFAVSPDGAWLAVAAGSGVIGEASSTAITVKHLAPPATATTP